MNHIEISKDVKIPVLGFGVFQIPQEQTAEAVKEAIKAGYRHIDTAQSYLNETEVGQGIEASGIHNQIQPQVNQIEINPFHQQEEQVAALQQENVVVEAWAPFAEGKNQLFQNQLLQAIADKYNKSIAQVILRWLVERDIVVLAKSVNPERMAQNLDIFDFELTEEDKQQIATLEESNSQFFSHADPEMIKVLTSRELDV
ncbi:TPA: aldo/keto reductase [Staphylococcus aureus]|nr:aldo/keto reductase [Staphylococcus aureus]